MKPDERAQWPPKYWKFQLETESSPKVEVAFTDPRRFGRIRLVDCPGEAIRKHSPLAENGPDPVVDADVFTGEYLRAKMRSRHVPVKALLLDQAMISGIGNWVADEVLYHAKLHPEQYCDDFGNEQIADLHRAVRYVCQTAVDKLGNSDEFPQDWLFNHRWGKGAKGAATKLPNGERLAFLTVGGRTSCYAPGIQKKTGRVVPGVKEEPLIADGEEEKKPKATESKSIKAVTEGAEEDEKPKGKRRRCRADAAVKEEPEITPKKARKTAKPRPEPVEGTGWRRSDRRSKKWTTSEMWP